MIKLPRVSRLFDPLLYWLFYKLNNWNGKKIDKIFNDAEAKSMRD